MSKSGLTKAANISVTAREIDFVSRFKDAFQVLLDALGISDLVRKEMGANVHIKKGVVTLGNSAGEGESVDYSQASVVEVSLGEITLEKYKTAVSAEAIKQYGYDIACGKTDDAFLHELQNKVTKKFYDFLLTGLGTRTEGTFQSALAMAKGTVDDTFERLRLASSGTVAFVNTLDFYSYLGGASITVQNAWGYQYVKDFMGYDTIFLCSSNDIPRKKVVATAKENVICYYIDPSDSDFAKAGFEFTTDGESNLIGFHIGANYDTVVSENLAIMGLTLSAEYIDAIAVIDIDAGTTAKTLTFTSAAGSTEGTKLTVTAPESIPEGYKFYVKAASTAPALPSYKEEFDKTGWTLIGLTSGVADNVTGFTSNHKMVGVLVNAAGQAIYECAAAGVTVTNKA